MRQSNRLVDDLLHRLENAILAGDMRPGERLLATQVAEEYEVSLTTVREALLMLEQKGLVISKPRRGTFVTRISEREAYELCQARALLESFAVSVCAGNISQDVLAQMAAQIDVMRTCQLPRDLPRLIQADLDFHQCLIEQSQSSQLVELWSRLNGRIGALILRSMEEQQLHINSVIALHQQLWDALHSGDLVQAQRAVVRHYLREQIEPQDNAELIAHTLNVVVPAVPVPSAESMR